MEKIVWFVSCLVLVASFPSQDTVAQSDVLILETPSSQQIIRALEPRPKTRGIRPLDGASGVENTTTKLALPAIQFEFGSATLTSRSRATLDVLADALSSAELEGVSLIIEGHTDAIGSPESNLSLSQARAKSVISYLVGQRGIDPDQLHPVGKGFNEPLPGINSIDGRNRRVQIVPSGGPP